MLPLQLLRVRTSKGEIFPRFCDKAEESELADTIVRAFSESAETREKKKLLEKRLGAIEGQYDDYKLVRGFATLLERRCLFMSIVSDSGASNVVVAAAAADKQDPASIRKEVFEESSRAGLALTEMERESIIANVGSKLKLSPSYIKQMMWSDLEENLILDKFDKIDGASLVAWYNLSLMQTLLFNCTRLDFSVSGGANWKRVLRNLKHLGLMYNLQQKERIEQEGHSSRDTVVDGGDDIRPNNKSEPDPFSNTEELTCSLDGPVSLFKLTDRYGTSIAKLLPSIIASETWSLNASIVRKTMSGKKIYTFRTDSSQAPSQLIDPHQYQQDHHRNSKNSSNSNSSEPLFDSSVEEKFARKFEQAASNSGWKLVREPDPIADADGRAFIPDFAFEKYGRRVYLEIVGFWTKEYVERKMHKLLDAISSKSIDLLIALNENLACTKIAPSFLSSIAPEKLIIYKNDSVPTKEILGYLKSIDEEQNKKYLSNTNLTIRFDRAREIIQIDDILSEYKSLIPPDSVIKIALRDNEDNYLKAGTCFILKSKANKMAALLAETTKFQHACMLLSENAIPEPCHAELLSQLGYDVLWQNMDSSSAVIMKRK